MNLYITHAGGTSDNTTGRLNIFCQLSNIKFEFYDSCEFGILIPPKDDCVLAMTYSDLDNIIKSGTIVSWLDNFFKKNSYLIIDQDIDTTSKILNLVNKNQINLFNAYKKRIFFYYIGTFENNVKEALAEFNLIKKQESEYLVRGPAYYYNYKIKKLKLQRINKFLLTTIIKKNRNHRSLLAKYLEDENLIDHHIGKISYGRNDNWEGDTFGMHDWHDGIISWDLYYQSSFEIVPEALYKDATYITEKTLKPIVARIPFLILSNTQFYYDFKKLGFKTFESLIDESFANEQDISLRTKKLVATAKNIINNNALEFYQASKEICNYNFDHLLYLKSKDEYTSYLSYVNIEKHINDLF